MFGRHVTFRKTKGSKSRFDFTIRERLSFTSESLSAVAGRFPGVRGPKCNLINLNLVLFTSWVQFVWRVHKPSQDFITTQGAWRETIFITDWLLQFNRGARLSNLSVAIRNGFLDSWRRMKRTKETRRVSLVTIKSLRNHHRTSAKVCGYRGVG